MTPSVRPDPFRSPLRRGFVHGCGSGLSTVKHVPFVYTAKRVQSAKFDPLIPPSSALLATFAMTILVTGGAGYIGCVPTGTQPASP